MMKMVHLNSCLGGEYIEGESCNDLLEKGSNLNGPFKIVYYKAKPTKWKSKRESTCFPELCIHRRATCLYTEDL